MKLNVLLLLLVGGSFKITYGVFPALEIINTAAGIVSTGISMYETFIIKKADNNSKLAIETMNDLMKAYEIFEGDFENRITHLNSTIKLLTFQETVGFPAQHLFMMADSYLRDQSRVTEQLLLNECSNNAINTRLNSLNTMISDSWFLTQAESYNYRLPDVESLRIRILHAMKELVFSHFVCMAVQNEPVEKTEMTGIILSSVANIIDTVDEELKVIGNSFFPKYIVKEVGKLAEYRDFPQFEDKVEPIKATAETIMNMLKKNYGKGIIGDLKNQHLFEKYYRLRVGKFPTFGKMPENAIVDIEMKDYYILIARSHRFELADGYDKEVYEDLMFSNDCKYNDTFKDSPEFDVFALTKVSKEHVSYIDWSYTKRMTTCEKPSLYCSLAQTPLNLYITSVPLGMSTAEPKTAESTKLQNEQEINNIRELRSTVEVEFKTVQKNKPSTASSVSESAMVTVLGLTMFVKTFFLVVCVFATTVEAAHFTLYKNHYFGETSQDFYADDHKCHNIQGFMDNIGSSINTHDHCFALYQQPNCEGPRAVFDMKCDGGECCAHDTFTGCDFHDKASSYRMC